MTSLVILVTFLFLGSSSTYFLPKRERSRQRGRKKGTAIKDVYFWVEKRLMLLLYIHAFSQNNRKENNDEFFSWKQKWRRQSSGTATRMKCGSSRCDSFFSSGYREGMQEQCNLWEKNYRVTSASDLLLVNSAKKVGVEITKSWRCMDYLALDYDSLLPSRGFINYIDLSKQVHPILL